MKIGGVRGNTVPAFVFLVACFILLQPMKSSAAPSFESYPGYFSSMYQERQSPKYLLQTISRLRQALLNEDELENSKRGLDLGLGRGFSGSQAAKHLMGLAAANFAGGPGRRRRSEDYV